MKWKLRRRRVASPWTCFACGEKIRLDQAVFDWWAGTGEVIALHDEPACTQTDHELYPTPFLAKLAGEPAW